MNSLSSILSATFYPIELSCYNIATLAWNNGMLIGNPTTQNGCSTNSFKFFDPITGTFKYNVIPDLNFAISRIINGQGNDIWAALGQSLYYYSFEHNQWNTVNVRALAHAYIQVIEWDSLNNYLLIFATGSSEILAKLTLSEYPSTEIILLDPGTLSTYGYIYSLATIQQSNSENYGFFSPVSFFNLFLSFELTKN